MTPLGSHQTHSKTLLAVNPGMGMVWNDPLGNRAPPFSFDILVCDLRSVENYYLLQKVVNFVAIQLHMQVLLSLRRVLASNHVAHKHQYVFESSFLQIVYIVYCSALVFC